MAEQDPRAAAHLLTTDTLKQFYEAHEALRGAREVLARAQKNFEQALDCVGGETAVITQAVRLALRNWEEPLRNSAPPPPRPEQDPGTPIREY